MDPHRWEEICSTFDALVELDPASRVDRLKALGSSDPELRAAVESLLGADAEADGRLASLEAPQIALTPAVDYLGLSGRTISHFRVLEPLGAGGMGVVYRAEDTRLGRVVALKFLLPQPSSDASAKARFLREARSVAALDHPNLCTLHEAGETEDGRLFLAMAFYSGETLKARLDRQKSLPVQGALDIARQVAQGLTCAHAAGIVHRDLKPGNVMLLPDESVKILDFGLARARDDSLSTTGALLGTVAYMSPEQIRGETVDARSDLWALGVVLYEMLTGRKPFAGEEQVAIAHTIVHSEPMAPSVFCKNVPGAVDETVLGLLQKEPSARYAGAEELLADLERLGTVGGATERGEARRPFRTTRRRVSAWRWVAILGAVLAIGGVGGTAISTWLRPVRSRPMSFYSLPFTDDDEPVAVSGPTTWIAISPDGDRVVYVGKWRGGGTQLWMRARDQLHSTALPGTVGAGSPFFSPDGSRVGFVTAYFADRPTLKVVSLAGGASMTVTDSAVGWSGGAWGHDGYIYFNSRLKGQGIARVPENGGIPEPVTVRDTAKEEGSHIQPEPLPSRKGVLFGITSSGDESGFYIGVLDLRTGGHRVLVRGLAPHYTAGHLVYVTTAGVLMAAPFDQDELALTGEPVRLAEEVKVGDFWIANLATSANGRLIVPFGQPTRRTVQLVWVSREGKETPVDTTWQGNFGSLALSPDGTHVAVSVRERDGAQLWIKRLDQGPASKLMSEGDVNALPAWTPDGRAVTFLSNSRSHSKRHFDLYLAMADGSALPKLLRNESESIWEAQYSNDGEWLVYRAGTNLFATHTAGDTTPIPLVTSQPRRMAAVPRLSPDGRWLAYASDESGALEVYVRPFPNTGTAKWQVSRNQEGTSPVWSRDGRELFYVSRGRLIAVMVRSGKTFAIGQQRVLLVVSPRYRTATFTGAYDVSPDGKRFIMIRSPDKARDELMVLDNFTDLLKPTVKR